ncbi:MAG: serine/threonine protein kinase [Deltaproteobacteria bacterium]|nr:serine/threonine protein kinase [Deltaproteobacteria bacterium]
MVRRLGKFVLLKDFASGGMAEIHIAKQPTPDGGEKLVVIKMLRSDLKNNREFVHLFLNEARIAARLMHPNVVQMYDLGYAEGEYFIAMEYVHGENAFNAAKACSREKTRIPLQHVVYIMNQTCTGLHYAHQKTDVMGRSLNIVHCDISPHNIMVSFAGEVKILDFGVAKAASRFEKKDDKTIKGKIPYMSPEQIMGKPLDGRSDVYSAGIVLWELSTGWRRYRKMDDKAILKDIVRGSTPPPSKYNSNIPDQLEAVILKTLVKNPDSRFQSALEMQAALEDVAKQANLTSTPTQLGTFMQRLFADRLDEAKQIERAQEDGDIQSALFKDVDFSPGEESGLYEDDTPAEVSAALIPVIGELIEEPADEPQTEPDQMSEPPEVTKPGPSKFLMILLLGIMLAALAVLFLVFHNPT